MQYSFRRLLHWGRRFDLFSSSDREVQKLTCGWFPPNSSSRPISTLLDHPVPGDGDVDYRGLVDIWHHYQFYDVFPGGTGFLGELEGGGWVSKQV